MIRLLQNHLGTRVFDQEAVNVIVDRMLDEFITCLPAKGS